MKNINENAKIGRPALYNSPEEMQEAIDLYFKEEVGIEHVGEEKDGKQKIIQKPPTVSGLALYLGFSGRCSMYDYAEREAFSYTIKRAIARIEQYAEKGLLNGTGGVGAIFWLKNHGWKDQQHLNHTGLTIKFDKEDETA